MKKERLYVVKVDVAPFVWKYLLLRAANRAGAVRCALAGYGLRRGDARVVREVRL